jgi:hypothetical protein
MAIVVTDIGSGTTTSAGAAFSVNATAAASSGIILVTAFCKSTSLLTVTGSDARLNTYQSDKLAQVTTAPNAHAAILTAAITTPIQIGDAITTTWSASVSDKGIGLFNITGLATGTWVRDSNSNTGLSTTNPASGAIAGSVAGDLIFGCCGMAGTGVSFTAGSGYTGPIHNIGTGTSATTGRLGDEYKIAAGANENPGGTITSTNWGMVGVAYIPAAAAPTTENNLTVLGMGH